MQERQNLKLGETQTWKLVDNKKWLDNSDYLTKRQLETSVQQDSMRCWVLGAIYLIRLHQDLCIHENPFT